MALPTPELRLYGKNLNKVRPGHSRNYWTDIEQWKAARESVTGKVPTVVNVTTRSSEWSRELSPMLLGPVDTYQEAGKMLQAVNAEVAWQYSKIYSHQKEDGKLRPLNFLTADGRPNPQWFAWRDKAWTNPKFHYAHKKFDDNKDLVRRAFPKGSKVAGWYWDGRTIDPVTARREIYATVYCKAVRTTNAFKKLTELFAQGDVAIYDIDGYDYVALGMSPEETILDLNHSWGHGLLLALMLSGVDPTQLGKSVPPHRLVPPPAPVAIRTVDRIVFGKSRDSYGWLGNMDGELPVEYEGITYKSSEDLFQCLRFPDNKEAQADIRSSTSPLWAKKRAAGKKDQLKTVLRDTEDLKRMRFCLVLKLKHNPEIIEALLKTGSKEIIEDCTNRPNDQEIDGSNVDVPFWGAILDGENVIGENALGKLWMELRDELRTNGKAVAVSPKGDMVEVSSTPPPGKWGFAKPLRVDSPLSPAEKSRLKILEKKIRVGQKKIEDGFAEMIESMFEIYQQRLFRQGGQTFADYFHEKWKFQRAHSYRLIHCGRLLSEMKPSLQSGFTKQAHFRPLLSLGDDARIASALRRVEDWKTRMPQLELSPAVVESAAVFEVALAQVPMTAAEAKISAVTVDGLIGRAQAELKRKPVNAAQIMRNLQKEVAALGRKSSTGINWTQATWNPLQGCRKISAGCQYCYAATILATRLKGHYPGIAVTNTAPKKGASPYDFTGTVLLLVDALAEPINCKTPKRYFVNSLSDLFFDPVPDWFIEQVFDVMEKASWHVFQVLTKRPERMAQFTQKRYPPGRLPPTNIWLGATIEDQKQHDKRMPHLKQVVASVKWLSCEPLLERVRLDLNEIQWVVVGGESNSGRKMEKAWATEIRDQCKKAKVAFFFKQWGDFGEDGNPNEHVKKNGPETLDGEIEHAFP